jgi:hypothetical protein
MMKRWILSALVLSSCIPLRSEAADLTAGMKEGNVSMASAGQIAFAPDGVFLVADPKSATIVAIATGDLSPASDDVKYSVDKIDEKIAAALGTASKEIQIVDIATNPLSKQVYVSVARGRGPDATPVLLRVGQDGAVHEVSTKGVKHSLAKIPNPADDKEGRRGNPRAESITDIAYINGKVFVAGLSNEEFASNLRTIEFPFKEFDKGSSVEIYHGAHGAVETRSPVRTFAAYSIDGQEHLLAAYTCTPLVKIPLNALEPGKKVRGVTVAELGNRNRPLDMVVYKKDGKNFVLMANSARGVMKISTDSIKDIEGIETKINDKAGLTYETIESLKGVEQLDRLSETQAVVLSRSAPDAAANLTSIALP